MTTTISPPGRPEVTHVSGQAVPARRSRRRWTGWRDLLDALWGLVVMAAAAVTPFARPARNRWGMGEAADRRYPGDGLIEAPRWQWTHGVEIEAPPTAVWPWVAQVGVDRGGFYSYAALENLVGCGVRNAEEVRPAWAHRPGDRLVLHPKLPALEVVGVVPGRWLLAHGEPPPGARARGDPWVAVTWLLLVEDLGAGRSRFVSRYRCATSDDLATRLRFGPTLVEPVAFAMDRRMLLGVKARAERHPPPAAPPGRAPSVEPGSVRPRAGGDGRPARTAARQHHGGGATAAPRRLPGPVRSTWRALARPTVDPVRFDPAVADAVLPAPAARWLRHAIEPGTPLRRTALLAMQGEIRVGRWMPFTAAQVLAPPDGFVWAASAGRGPLRVRGFDRYADGEGDMRWALFGLVPVMSAGGADVTRSAAGRLAGEALLVPGAAVSPAVTWRAVDERRAVARVHVGRWEHDVTVEVDDRGALRSISMPRWGDPDGTGYAERLFAVSFGGEVRADGFTLPRAIEAAWGPPVDAAARAPAAPAGDRLGDPFFRA
ncbi:MAG: DUF6544 family protein, partial [Acidimicrobiia bacterium]